MLLFFLIMRLLENECFLIPLAEEPLDDLFQLFIEISKFQNALDVYIDFAFENSTLWTPYFETTLRCMKFLGEERAFHFNRGNAPLRTHIKHLVFTDSVDALR